MWRLRARTGGTVKKSYRESIAKELDLGGAKNRIFILGKRQRRGRDAGGKRPLLKMADSERARRKKKKKKTSKAMVGDRQLRRENDLFDGEGEWRALSRTLYC
ncbi:hypothetical protein CDL15_Pgr019596 [Punica granatum]|uniref:Uncharacterized protein n=1 Tax=Punica granatum TaxID=22663 RepID=A0A218X6K0_PUNGR|nr:hypothetical protein CDL15_Pgr019596 [Punica granatum]PKI38568.1 hypothetical protein CRG98_041001 [Punica granatum]